MTVRHPDRGAARRLLHRAGGARRWVLVAVLLGTITVTAGIALVGMAVHLLTISEVLGLAAAASMTILGVRAAAVARVVVRYCDRYIGHLGTFRILTRLRVWIFGALVDAEPLGTRDHPRGEIVNSLVEDVESMQDHVLRVSVPPWVAFASLLIGATAIAVIEGDAALAFALAFVLAAVPAPLLLRRRAITDGTTLMSMRAARMTACVEDLDALDELVAWGRADRLSTTLESIAARERRAENRVRRDRIIADIVVTLATGLGVVAVAALSLPDAANSPELTWVLGVPLLALAAFEALGPVLSAGETAARTDAAAARVQSIVDDHRPLPRPTPVPAAHVSPTPDIRLDDLSFVFPDGTTILDGASLAIPWGSTVAVLAPSGTGKSTLVDLLLGLRRPVSGRVLVGGVDVRSIDHDDTRTVLAAVLQDDHLFDTSIRDNLRLADADLDDADMTNALTAVGLGAFLDERSLDGRIGPDGSEVSGGERQRLLVARAMLADAPILLLDEAGEHLDRELRRAVVTDILERRRGRTTIVFAHDADAIDVADLVVEMLDGRLTSRPISAPG